MKSSNYPILSIRKLFVSLQRTAVITNTFSTFHAVCYNRSLVYRKTKDDTPNVLFVSELFTHLADQFKAKYPQSTETVFDVPTVLMPTVLQSYTQD